MVNGIDIAASGMVSIIDLNDIIANNLANANTTGFKQLIPTFRNIQDFSVPDMNKKNGEASDSMTSIGNLSAGSMIDATQLDFSQGSLHQTDKKLDLAINGEGFFTVETEKGQFYTRNGSFSVNDEGDIVTKEGYKVLGEGGRGINIDLEDIGVEKLVITRDGRIMSGTDELDKLKMVDFEDKTKLKMMGTSLFRNSDPDNPPVELKNGAVMQGYLETSNANVVKTMINSISGARTYETLSKIIKDTDATLRKTVNEVGTVIG
ncbi:MAG TPA: flagellar basal-body rod protein FlgF [Candidatus Gastranaerophilales bacterium]|nr:flagellar basal-body rod protein FlgF [Candidatus Gastranaerophilales bacterium]